MRGIKKIDSYVIRNFLGIFLLTLVICCFILLMQFVWSHVNDLVGKGVGISVLAEFFVYAITSVVPMALPLAILLASLMCFGNLGEKSELTAMKAAGISLFRIMRPLMVFIGFICVLAFGFSNYVLPRSQVKLWTLIFSLRQKSPEMEIPAGEFYTGLSGYQIYVDHKQPRTGLLEGVMIYNFANGFNNASVMVADSGRIYFTDDNHYLLLALYAGEQFENLSDATTAGQASSSSVPYRRESFSCKKLLIEFNSGFDRMSDSTMSGQYVSMNVFQLQSAIDSLQTVSDSILSGQSRQLAQTSFRAAGPSGPSEQVVMPQGSPAACPRRTVSLDALYASLSPQEKRDAMQHALDEEHMMRDQLQFNHIMAEDVQHTLRRDQIEWWRKFTLSFACLIFFFIGAPLGAIIRKGGMGLPTVVSVIMFIVYYMIDNTGYKMARDGLWPAWQGMLLSSAILLPIGIFLSYKAATDSALFNMDAQRKIIRNILCYLKSKRHWRISVPEKWSSWWMTRIARMRVISSRRPN